jgi:ADP-ribosylation factor-like protein 2
MTQPVLISYKLNIWDVGGQKSIRSYWRNYFEQTDALIWVVDSADRLRLNDCKVELSQLLQEERLAGATLLVFANKQDIAGALTEQEIKNVRGFSSCHIIVQYFPPRLSN